MNMSFFKCGRYQPELHPDITIRAFSLSFFNRFLPNSRTLGNDEQAIP